MTIPQILHYVAIATSTHNQQHHLSAVALAVRIHSFDLFPTREHHRKARLWAATLD